MSNSVFHFLPGNHSGRETTWVIVKDVKKPSTFTVRNAMATLCMSTFLTRGINAINQGAGSDRM